MAYDHALADRVSDELARRRARGGSVRGSQRRSPPPTVTPSTNTGAHRGSASLLQGADHRMSDRTGDRQRPTIRTEASKTGRTNPAT